MANYERDARPDDVRVFDGAEDEEDVEGSRLPLLIVIALLVLAAFGAVVWLAYQRGVQQGHTEIPRVIAAEPGPARVAPTNAGGTPTPYTGLKIYQQPAPSDETGDADTAPPPPSTVPPKPAPTAMTPAPVPAKPTPAPVTAPPLAAPTMAAKPPPTAAPPAPPKPTPAPPKPTPTQVVAAPPPVKPPVDTPVATPAPAPTAPAGSALLQIGSYKSQAEAEAAWTAYKAKHPAVAGLSPDIKSADLGAKGTWYRLRIAAGSKADAATLCEKLKSEGSACIPTK